MNQRVEFEWTELQARYPDLFLTRMPDGIFRIRGLLPVFDANNDLRTSYNVLIEVAPDYPGSFPKIWETGGKINRDGSWHTNPDESCCVGTIIRQYHKLSSGMTLLKWVEIFAIPYLANHLYRVENGHYAEVERSHGLKGYWEEYSELFGIDDPKRLMQTLRFGAGQIKIGRNDPCPCGSGKKYKKCFIEDPEAHRLHVPLSLIQFHIREFERILSGPGFN